MFKRCSNLNYVKASFVTDPNSKLSRDLFDWLDGVSYTGTFVKNAAAKWDVRGSSGIPEGWTIEYETADLGLPTVGDVVIENAGYKTVTVRSSSSNDASEISQCGFYYGTSANDVTTWARSFNFEDGVFSREITGLRPGTTYYIKSYVTNETGTVESDVVSFTTLATYGTINGHEWVDIGIRKSMYDSTIEPGSSADRRIVFAEQNIGAGSHYDNGYFFRGNELYGWDYTGSITASTEITNANLSQKDKDGHVLRSWSGDYFTWDENLWYYYDFEIRYETGDAVKYYLGEGWKMIPHDLARKILFNTSFYATLPTTDTYTFTDLTGLSLAFTFNSSGRGSVIIANEELGTSIYLPGGSLYGWGQSYYYPGFRCDYWVEGAIEPIYAGALKHAISFYVTRQGYDYDPDVDDYTTWKYAWTADGYYAGVDCYEGHHIRAVAELPL